MAGLAQMTIAEGVAVITLDNPPVNALGHALRTELQAAFRAALADPGVLAIVIRAAGRSFPAGADIKEFGQMPRAPGLPDLCREIEAAHKPVIATLHGTVLGGGLELALAAHYRVAAASTLLGFPEVTLGILPGAGGTQRAPRLIGAAEALRLMLTGAPITAAEALTLGLIDRVVDGDPTAAALELAVRQPVVRPSLEQTGGLRDPLGYSRAVAEARAKLVDGPVIAPGRIVDCVEAALLLPPDAGLAFERAAFEDCVGTDAAAALRHAFFAERRAARIPEALLAQPRAVETVGVVGGGLMGAGIVAALIGAGLRCVLIERDRDALAQALERVAGLQERAVEKGRLTAAARDADWARLGGSTDLLLLAGADMVIEAVPDDPGLKSDLFRQLAAILQPGAILASNTSYLDLDALAAASGRPADVIGLHFFAPVPAMRLVEVGVAASSAPDAVLAGFALARRLGKVAVRAGATEGLIGNRILTAYRAAADVMLEQGASPASVDAAMRGTGFPMGPYQVIDMAGLDISWARRKRAAALHDSGIGEAVMHEQGVHASGIKSPMARDPGAHYVAIGDRLCEAGALGQKAGRGYYRHVAGVKPEENPEALAIIAAERARKGIVARRVEAVEIRRRCLSAMLNEAVKLLEAGVALRPSDIDVVLMLGYGFPRWLGGIMKLTDTRGLLAMRRDLLVFAGDDPGIWAPRPLLSELIKNGRLFEDLNEGQ